MKKLLLLSAFTYLSSILFSQDFRRPTESQRSEVKQVIGVSEISIVYHSPGVKGRTIWGDLIPYDRIWRCGANENTIIRISDTAQVEGQGISAGTYGVHMIPSEQEWTIIFSKDTSAWGSYNYNKERDALRVKVKPIKRSENVEWLNYGFKDREPASVITYLEWEKLIVPFKVTFDVNDILSSKIQRETRSFARSAIIGAQYCLDNNVNHDQGIKWADAVLGVNPENFNAGSIKSGLLAQKGDMEASKKALNKALEIGTERQINWYGYQLVRTGRTEEAIEVFKKNVERFPKSWNVFDSLAEAYQTLGKNKEATSNYKKALSNNPPEDQKARIEGILKDL